MNYKIICDDKNIEFTNSYPALAFSDDDCKSYYRVNNNIIEVDYLKIDNINESRDLRGKYKMIFVILKSIEENQVNKINSILKHDNVIIGVRGKKAFSQREDIIMFNGINEKINVEALIDIFSNKEVLMNIKDKSKASSMIIGDEVLNNSFTNIQKNILKSFGYIDNYKEYVMYLYCSKEFNLEETANIEDLLREYLYEARKIEIKQVNDSEIKDNVFYSILATR